MKLIGAMALIRCRETFLLLAIGMLVGTQLRESVRHVNNALLGSTDARGEALKRSFQSAGGSLRRAGRSDESNVMLPSTTTNEVLKDFRISSGQTPGRDATESELPDMNDRTEISPVRDSQQVRDEVISADNTLTVSESKAEMEESTVNSRLGVQTEVGEGRNDPTIAPTSVSQPPPPTTAKSMSACLLLLDDTIRLVEWLAYHYTVLPLRHLIIAIDPNSHRDDEIHEILAMWGDRINITTYVNDTWLTLEPEEGWGRMIRAENGRVRGWFRNKNNPSYLSQAHKRRQNFFFSFCLQELYATDRESWAVLIDSDEFLLYNYRHPEHENPDLYDAENEVRSKADIDNERERNLPVREQLPSLADEVTMAEFLHSYENATVLEYGEQARPRCLNVPHLQFATHESHASVVNLDIPAEVDPGLLMTMSQRMTGPMVGEFSKGILNLATAPTVDWFRFDSVVNVHTPNRRMCGRKGRTGSGTDFIGALLRLHHHRAGNVETYLQRSADYRGGSIWRFFNDRNFDPVGENDDIRPWLSWFMRKVGESEANRLLFQPLQELYTDVRGRSQVEEAKAALTRLSPGMLLRHNSTDNNDDNTGRYDTVNKTDSPSDEDGDGGTGEGAACLYIMDDSIRLMEWLAYHYTVFPLRHLIVGIDSRSKFTDRIQKVLKRWKSHIEVKIYTNSSWLAGIQPDEAWKRRLKKDDGSFFEWYLNKSSQE